MEPIFTMTSFTPAEAAAITGVSPDLQRDWRRREYLSRNEGHARFDAFDVARMLVLQLLADRGIGPKVSHELAQWCALGIVENALRASDGWEGDVDKAPVPPDAPRLDENALKLAERMPEHFRDEFLANFDGRWKYRAEYLVRWLWRSFDRPLLTPGRCFIWWADGSHTFALSFDKALNDLSASDPKTHGPMVVLDYFSLATLLQERAGRALCHVEFVETPE